MSKNYIIGEILETGEIERGESYNGYIYKSLEAFLNKSGICYVPELSDNKYTYKDFLDMVNGNEEIARILFDSVDWQYPETKLNELITEDEINFCMYCENTYDSYEVDYCPHCGQLKVVNSFNEDNYDVYVFKVGEKEYKVHIDVKSLNKMNWSWESLMFPNNDTTFAILKDETEGNTTYLVTSGFVKVTDILENRVLDDSEIEKLAMEFKVNDESLYSIDNNNWFSLEHYNKNKEMLEDVVFNSDSKRSLDLATEIVKSHIQYFSR